MGPHKALRDRLHLSDGPPRDEFSREGGSDLKLMLLPLVRSHARRKCGGRFASYSRIAWGTPSDERLRPRVCQSSPIANRPQSRDTSLLQGAHLHNLDRRGQITREACSSLWFPRRVRRRGLWVHDDLCRKLTGSLENVKPRCNAQELRRFLDPALRRPSCHEGRLLARKDPARPPPWDPFGVTQISDRHGQVPSTFPPLGCH